MNNIPKLSDFEFYIEDKFISNSKDEYIARIKKTKFPLYEIDTFVLVKRIDSGDWVIVGQIELNKNFGDPRGFE